MDGQVSYELVQGDILTIKKSDNSFQTVRNPRHPRWHNLVNKLNWGQSPVD